MSKNGNRNNIHGLVLFKGKDSKKAEEDEIGALESVDQENKIKLISELTSIGVNYRYSILLVNQSEAPITEIKTRLKFPSFLSLSRTIPPNLNINLKKIDRNTNQLNLEFDELPEKIKKQINFYFTPLELNVKGEIATYITFVNNKDFVRVLNTEPISMSIENISIMPKIIPSFEIQKFLQKEGIHKAIKSIGIEIEGDKNFLLFFNHMEQILQVLKFQLIAKDEDNYILWSFGSDLESKEDILVIGQIISNKIEFLAASHNRDVLVSLLTNLGNDFKKHLLSIGIVQSLDQIHELLCNYCGNVLPKFPEKGGTVECSNCKSEIVIW